MHGPAQVDELAPDSEAVAKYLGLSPRKKRVWLSSWLWRLNTQGRVTLLSRLWWGLSVYIITAEEREGKWLSAEEASHVGVECDHPLSCKLTGIPQNHISPL